MRPVVEYLAQLGIDLMMVEHGDAGRSRRGPFEHQRRLARHP